MYIPTMRLILSLLFLATMPLLSQEIQFSLPIQGTIGKDYYLVNHVDLDTSTGSVKDYMCGVQTYDGHQGTDFVLRSFRQMDSGVSVIAAADGVVTAVVDSLFDRQKRSVKDRGFGNYVAIEHRSGFVSYYAHLRKNSASVRVGDTVRRGRRLGLVGSSGNSEDPHVHFEVWQRVDPFAGNCSKNASLWKSQPVYSDGFVLIDHDVTSWPPTLDTLRERPPRQTMFGLSDSTITFWSLQQGVLPTDEIAIEWFTPDNTSWFLYRTTAGIRSQYFYFWSYIQRPERAGTWTLQYSVNGVVKLRDTIQVAGSVQVPIEPDSEVRIVVRQGTITVEDVLRRPATIEIYDSIGRLLQKNVGDHLQWRVSQPVYCVVIVGNRRFVLPLLTD